MGKDNLWIIGAYGPWRILFLFLTPPLSPLHHFQKSTLVTLMNNQMGNYNFAMSVERVGGVFFFTHPFFSELAVSACQSDIEGLDMALMISLLPPALSLKIQTQEEWRHQATRHPSILARHFFPLSVFHMNKVQTQLKDWDFTFLYIIIQVHTFLGWFSLWLVNYKSFKNALDDVQREILNEQLLARVELINFSFSFNLWNRDLWAKVGQTENNIIQFTKA